MEGGPAQGVRKEAGGSRALNPERQVFVCFVFFVGLCKASLTPGRLNPGFLLRDLI